MCAQAQGAESESEYLGDAPAPPAPVDSACRPPWNRLS